MNKYPMYLGDNNWVIEIKNSDGSIREINLVLQYDTLSQMGWDGEKDINIHSIMENDYVNLQNKPNLLQSNMESINTH